MRRPFEDPSVRHRPAALRPEVIKERLVLLEDEGGAGRIGTASQNKMWRSRSAPHGVFCLLVPLSRARRFIEAVPQAVRFIGTLLAPYGRLKQRQTGRSAGRADASEPPGARPAGTGRWQPRAPPALPM